MLTLFEILLITKQNSFLSEISGFSFVFPGSKNSPAIGVEHDPGRSGKHSCVGKGKTGYNTRIVICVSAHINSYAHTHVLSQYAHNHIYTSNPCARTRTRTHAPTGHIKIHTDAQINTSCYSLIHMGMAPITRLFIVSEDF